MALRARIRRVLKWTGLAVCVLTLLGCWGWTFSSRPWFPHPRYCAPRWGFSVGREWLSLYYVTIVPPPGKTARDFTEHRLAAQVASNLHDDNVMPGVDVPLHASWLPSSRGYSVFTKGGFRVIRHLLYAPMISLPLLILIPVGTITGLLWYLDRRRSRPGHCEDCGYDLTGNVSGRCPECGATITLLGDAAEPDA